MTDHQQKGGALGPVPKVWKGIDLPASIRQQVICADEDWVLVVPADYGDTGGEEWLIAKWRPSSDGLIKLADGSYAVVSKSLDRVGSNCDALDSFYS